MPGEARYHREVATLRVCLAALLILPTTPLAGQDPEPEPWHHPRLLEAVEVHLVNVDAVVQDREGAPIPDLAAADFEILEDGQPVELSHFAAVGGGGRVQLVLLLDEAGLAPAWRSAVLAQLAQRSRQLTAVAKEVMVVRLQPELRVEQGFSADPEAVARALEGLQQAAPAIALEAAEEDALLAQIRRAPTPGVEPSGGLAERASRASAESDATALLAAVRRFASEQRDRSLRALTDLSQLVLALAPLPGRKALLLVSGGFDLRPGEQLFRTWLDRYRGLEVASRGGSVELEIPRYALGRELDELVAAAGASGVAMYILAPGAGPSPLESRDTPVVTGTFLSGPVRPGRPESLRRLAQETGGAAVFSLEAMDRWLAQWQADLAATYSLAYRPLRPDGGGEHQVEVRVRRPGARVRHFPHQRRAPERGLEARAASALILGIAANPMGLRVEPGRQVREQGGMSLVSLELKVPLSRLVFLPRGDAHEGRIRVFILSRDGRGRIPPGETITAPISIPNDRLVPAMGQLGTFSADLRLPAGAHRIAVAVRDEIGARDSALSLDLTVGPPPP